MSWLCPCWAGLVLLREGLTEKDETSPLLPSKRDSLALWAFLSVLTQQPGVGDASSKDIPFSQWML